MNLFNRVNERLIAEDSEEATVCNLSKSRFEAIADYLGCNVDELRVAGIEEYNKIEDKVYLNEYDDLLRRQIETLECYADLVDTAVKDIEYDEIKVFEFEHNVFVVLTDRSYGYVRIFRK